jgi:hypothetical protein
MPDTKRQRERLIALLLIGIIAVNYPVLSLFSKVKQIFNIPVLYLYIFFCWAVFIFCVAIILERPSSPLPKMKISDRHKVD